MQKPYRKNTDKYREIFALLLKHIKNVDVVQEKGHTPLLFAVEIEEVELVKMLLEHGADKNFKLEGKTPYDCAQHNHNLELMSLLK